LFLQESATATDDKNFDAEISSEFDTIKKKKGGVLREVITANKEKTLFGTAIWFKTNGYTTKRSSYWC
jgi:hypothetical protein